MGRDWGLVLRLWLLTILGGVFSTPFFCWLGVSVVCEVVELVVGVGTVVAVVGLSWTRAW